ncbi:ice-binding family protein [Microbacterium caowuchunii]|uniref:ice-binding family protein n=1 Tax=Microbacterium caowuchunii TaxID=2614638 RepID=UPI0019310162|nr:ice-binding family protein [Microbacterium caowuchunii]
MTLSVPAAFAATAIDLGTADSYVVLGGSTVTNTGTPTVLNGDLGVHPGTAITGFPPGLVTGGTTHAGDTHAAQAKIDLVTAYDSATSQAPIATLATELGGQTLVEGVYTFSSTAGLTGAVTLQGGPDAVWVFQIPDTLITASSSTVVLDGGARACNVFWQVGSSATLGSGTDFVGTIMAMTSITVDFGATVEGRALARNGAVTLDNNVFTDARCDDDEAGNPDEPVTPGDPDDPVTPVDPDDPVTPGDPDDPVTPVDPDDPVTPGDPDDPVTPVDPDDPVTPGDPDDPVTPGDPDDPVTPVDPDDPVTPVDPDDPVAPGDPDDPVTPVDPDDPVTPVDPDDSGTPADPIEPVVPGTPSAPGNPAAGNPGTSATTATVNSSRSGASDALATTGIDGSARGVLLTAAGLLTMGGIFMVLQAARRRTARNT